MAELPVARRRLIRLRAPDAMEHVAQRNGAPLIRGLANSEFAKLAKKSAQPIEQRGQQAGRWYRDDPRRHDFARNDPAHC